MWQGICYFVNTIPFLLKLFLIIANTQCDVAAMQHWMLVFKGSVTLTQGPFSFRYIVVMKTNYTRYFNIYKTALSLLRNTQFKKNKISAHLFSLIDHFCKRELCIIKEDYSVKIGHHWTFPSELIMGLSIVPTVTWHYIKNIYNSRNLISLPCLVLVEATRAWLNLCHRFCDLIEIHH